MTPSATNSNDRSLSELIADYAYSLRVESDDRVSLEWADEGFCLMVGCEPGAPPLSGPWDHFVHPEDREKLEARTLRLLNGEKDVGRFRVLTRDGRSVLVRDAASPVRDPSTGRVTRIRGIGVRIASGTEEDPPRVTAQADANVADLFHLQWDLCTAVVRAGSAIEILEQLLIAAVRIKGVEIGAVLSVNEEADSPRLVSHRGLPEEFDDLLLSRIGVQALDRLRHHGSPLYGPLSEIFDDAAALPRRDAGRALGVIPLTSAEHILAVLLVGTEREGSFSADARHCLEAAATLAGCALVHLDTVEALSRIKERFDLAVQGSCDGLWDWEGDPDGKAWWSPRYYELLGFEDGEIEANFIDLQDCLHPDDKEATFQAIEDHLNHRKPYDVEYRLKTKSGQYRWFRSRGQAIWDRNGEPLRMSGSLLDVTDRKNAEARLQESEARLRAAIESLPFDFFLIDGDGRYAMQNAVCKQHWGDVAGKRPQDVAPDEQARALWLSNNRRAFSGEVVEGEVVLRVRGQKGTYYNVVSPILHGDEILGILGVNIDITDRKRAEEALKAEKEFTETALNAQTDTFFVFEPSTGRAVRWNKAFSDVTGYSDEEIRSMKAPESYYNEEDLKRATAASDRLRVEDFTTVELSLITKEGRSIPTEYIGSAIRDDEGSLRYIIAIGRDITDRKKAEDDLRRAHDELELRVWERTAELTAANEALSREVAERKNAQEALQKSEERFRAIFEKAGIGIATCDLDGRFIEVNPAFENMLGYSSEELRQRTFLDVTHPEDAAGGLEWFQQALRAWHDEGRIRDDDYLRVEKKYIRKNGEVMWGRLTACLMRDAKGQPFCGLGMVEDITAAKRAEQALRESEERLRLAVQNVPVMLNAMDENRDFVVWNSECERVTGYRADEIVGNPKARELLYPDAAYRERMMKEWANRQEDYRNWEWTLTCKDGAKKIIAWSHVSRQHPIPGWPFWGIGIDITEQRRAEEVVRKEAERFRLLAKATQDAVYDIDPINKRVWRNDSYQWHFGAPAETAIDDEWWLGRIHPDDRNRVVSAQGDLFQTEGESYADEYRLRRPDGSYAHVIDRAYVLRNEQGQPSRIIGALTDISERKRSEEALRESEERFRCLMEQAADAVFVHRPDGAMIAVNEEACRSLDYDREELLSGSVQEVVIQFKESHLASLWDRLASGEHITLEGDHRRKDGTTFPVETRLGLLDTGQEVQVLALARDVSQRKRAEEALRASEAKFRALAEAVPAAIFILQGDRLQYANPAAERLTGLAASSLHDPMLGKTVYPDLVNLAARCGPEIGSAGDPPSKCELKIATLDDRERWLDCSVSTVEYEGQPATLITGFDVTERKEAEELARRRLAELAHMSRLSTMGEMATGLAHELNQPLGTIANYAEGGLTRIKTGKANMEDLHAALEAIVAEAFRAGGIIRHTRQFLSRREPSKSSVDVNLAIREVVALLEYEIKAANIDLLLELAEPAPHAQGDHVFIQQVVLNLLRNAIEALAGVDEGWRRIRIRTSVDNEGEVVVSVADNGPGIDSDDLDTLFEPYFTTKPEGMGMGLSICRSIVAEHGGRLWASDSPDGGAVLHFSLPR
jgi:two-component system sensor kinase FixL